MQILHGLDGLLNSPKRSVMSVGNFDGVHLGHQRTFRSAPSYLRSRAHEAVDSAADMLRMPSLDYIRETKKISPRAVIS
jgi:FAD synthase